MLAELEANHTSFVICRNGEPVADLVPHRRTVSMAPDPKLGAFTIDYDPTEELGGTGEATEKGAPIAQA